MTTTTTRATDDELVARMEHGDVNRSLHELRSRHMRRIYTLVHSILRDRALASEVCEEVIEKVFFKSHLYQPGTNFVAWLLEVARNQALTALRARRRGPRPVSSLTLDDDAGDDESLLEAAAPRYEERTVEERELMAAFRAAVEELPERYRDVFELCVQGGMQYQQAARLLGIPPGTVAIRIMRARRRLYQTLSPMLGHVRRPPACFVN